MKVHDLYKHFNVSGGLLDQLSFRRGRLTRTVELVKALNGITLEVQKGEALCLVGGKADAAKPPSAELSWDCCRLPVVQSIIRAIGSITWNALNCCLTGRRCKWYSRILMLH